VNRNRRQELRLRRRFPCEVYADDTRHVGAILDLSRHGLFVQTRLQPRTKRRIPLDVKLRGSSRGSELLLSTELVRHFRVPASLLAAAGGGLGLAIRRAPDAWADFLASLSPHELLTREPVAPTPRAQAAAARCLFCGAPPVVGALLCGRCRRQARRPA
jgi:hypothetical protein